MASQTERHAFYLDAEPLTDPGPHRELLDSLPRGIPELCAAIQGLVLNFHWAQAYGVTLTEARRHDAQARSLGAILARILALDDRPLHEPRTPQARFAGTCRDFTVLLCAALRHQGVPARARCGFAAYFSEGRFEDHWVCEHWMAAPGRWTLIDAQLDGLQREALELEFDPLDVPRDQFLVAGQAWDRCTAGGADPARFGILDMRGLWFIRGNLLRDLAALNRMELLPWDGWGLMLRLGQADDCDPETTSLLNRVAALTQGGDADVDAMRRLYTTEPSLRVPALVTNFQTGAQESVQPSRAAPR
jgi:hypothetical protein